MQISENTKAILLLTAPLINGKKSKQDAELKPLTPGEYKRFARHLHTHKHEPADLLLSGTDEILETCQTIVDAERLQKLLARGFLLSQTIERWQSRAIWVVSRADAHYPRRLKSRLRENSPAILYGCGDISLLETGGLAVVGSRDVDETLVDYTMLVGQLTAQASRTLVSGGAKGIDQAAMRGALEAGGKACGVLANNLERTVMIRENRNLLLEGQLVLTSPYDPNAGFNVGNAMQRNKLIYALADTSLVVNSDLEKGGTWAGATEQIDKLKFVPVFVRSTGKPSPGLDALKEKGALPWPNPQDVDSFHQVFNIEIPTTTKLPELFLDNQQIESRQLKVTSQPETTSESELSTSPENSDHLNQSESAKALFSTVSRLIQQLLKTPKKDSEIAKELNVSTSQARAWLQRMVDEDTLEKQKKPTLYTLKEKRLFE